MFAFLVLCRITLAERCVNARCALQMTWDLPVLEELDFRAPKNSVEWRLPSVRVLGPTCADLAYQPLPDEGEDDAWSAAVAAAHKKPAASSERRSLDDTSGEGAAASIAFCPKLQWLDLREQELHWQAPDFFTALPVVYGARLTELGRLLRLFFVRVLGRYALRPAVTAVPCSAQMPLLSDGSWLVARSPAQPVCVTCLDGARSIAAISRVDVRLC